MVRAVLSLALILTIFISPFSFGFAQDITPLKNVDILRMVKAKVSSEQILERINNSSCAFDTFPTVLEELSYKGVPDEVITAMVKAPRGRRPVKPVATPVPTTTHVIKTPDNTASINTMLSPVVRTSPSIPSETTRSQPSLEPRQPSPPVARTAKQLKEIKIRGYITEFYSPTSFEIEDYRITRDESVVFEFENQNSEVSFKKEDLRIGTLVEIRGLFDEITSELRATKVKIDLAQFRQLDVTAVLDRKPLEVQQTESGWRGLIAADGRRVRITPETQMLFRPNRTEKNQGKQQEKAERNEKETELKNKQRELNRDNKNWHKMGKPGGNKSWGTDVDAEFMAQEFTPLTSLSDVGPGTIMTYHGREQADGTVLATKIEFTQNEMEKAEFDLWQRIKVRETSFNFESGKAGELKIGSQKYKVHPNEEVQDYVNRLGHTLIPEYQRALPESHPQKIHFKFRVVQENSFNAGCLPNGMIIIHSEVFNLLENEAQLTAVLAHEIAHATQEHMFREMRHNRKRRMALEIGRLVAAGMGYYSISKLLEVVNTAMIQGYNRTLENQSDRLSIQYMADAGYDIREAPRVWKLVAINKGFGPTFYWSSHDNAPERRSFMMVTIRNSFAGLDLSNSKKNEESFQRMAKLVREAEGKKKQKIRVLS
jgi:Zn-dependent protease with chaperone function